MTRVVALILAAGRARRFGAGENDSKVTVSYHGTPLVRLIAQAALASQAVSVTIVCGHARAQVEAALRGLDVQILHNADYDSGIASSLIVGLETISSDVDGILVLLGDMPMVTSDVLNRLIERFRETKVDAVVPTFEGRRGNPVLIGQRMFDSVRNLHGDEGARHLLAAPTTAIAEYEVGNNAIFIDVDTRADLENLKRLT